MPLAEAGFCYPHIAEADRSGILVVHGPTLQVTVGHMDTQATNVALDGNKATQSVLALVDTGALESCIDDQLAKKLGLPVIDKQQCSGASGPAMLDVHMAYIDIPSLAWGIYGRFMGVHLVAGGQQHNVLLGRTMLSNMVMIYDGPKGGVTIAR